MSHSNVGNEICSLDNAVQSTPSPHEKCVDNNVALLDSNQQADEQQSLELSSADEFSSINPREDTSSDQKYVNSNARKKIDFEVSHDRENNDVNSEITISDAENHNNQENGINAPVATPNPMALPLE